MLSGRDAQGRVHLLDPHATADVVRYLLDVDVDYGIQLRVTRRPDGEEMKTSTVEPAASHPAT